MKTSFSLTLLVAAVALIGTASSQAQATRTWVSGVGDDVNPCSRTAPCKTFAGAISKTATGGEISVLDPGGFGAITITKSITINGAGTLASILGAGTNGVTVNAPAGSIVILRHLEINGAGSGLQGINFINGGSLVVENCAIYGFTGSGINAAPTVADAKLQVNNCSIHDNDSVGILLKPTGSGTVKASVNHSFVETNAAGLRADAGGTMTVKDSVSTGNAFNGFIANAGGVINAHSCVASHNLNGVAANGGVLRMSDMTIMNNSGTGILPVTANSIFTFSDNKVAGNGTDGTAGAAIPPR